MTNLIGVHPALAFVVTEAIKITEQDFTVFEGVRSLERQKALLASGDSQTLHSYHLYGLAVDLVAWVDGQPSWDPKYYPAINRAVKAVMARYNINSTIENGADIWNGWDHPHWQMSGMMAYYDVRELAA